MQTGVGSGASEHVDVVVVGSGFGGSVAAYRLAEAGRSVVVLERGQAFPPGSFPRSPAEMGRAFWDPREGLYGMYDVWSFDGCDSVVSSGLGGGSLIYANVLLRKDERWFVHEHRAPDGGYEPWPVSRAELDPHYDAVERMMGASPYPLDRPAYADTPKTHAMQDAAAELGLDWFLPPLAISFAPYHGAEPGPRLPIAEPEYGNLHGVPRRTCRLCGECDIGCNDGAKNSLDFTYLSAARHHGADLRTSHEVMRIRPRAGGGYEVDYVHHDTTAKAAEAAAEAAGTPVRTIGCDRLVLAAGTYGTSYLLLRSRRELPGLGPALGTRFCGNGDLLTFLLRAKDRNRVQPLNAARGPVITSAIRLPDEVDGDPLAGSGHRGGYIQDGGYPGFVDWLVEGADLGDQIGRAARFLWERFVDFFSDAPDTNLSAELSELIGGGALSVSSLPLLGMGRDTPDGTLRLRKGRLEAVWTTETSEAHFERLRKTMQRIADVLGADYSDNPIWFRKRVVTVHPLGGAPMGRHPAEGVCDPYGEVFGHPGLYIADGSALPGPVGANPALTIAALADRMCMRLLDTGAGPAATGGAGAPAAAGPQLERPRPDATSLAFTEEMKGFWTPGAGDPRTGARGDAREPLSFRLTITADDVDRFLDDPEHTAGAEGWVEAPGLGGRRPVLRGWFNLFAPAGDQDRREMRYRLHLTDGEGRPLTLVGWKNVLHGPPTRIWPDTSTLYTRLLEGHSEPGGDAAARVLGSGVLHIRPADFAEQLTTFRTSGPAGLTALARFGRFFAGELWEVYGPGG
ncbi:cholesterol oxidase [Thermomonospora echinospora]|uniref:Cholesterol oxidase n=1 Tax=Thermomonospora echinospora TaxID=1992 RepID=A0A1H6D4M0_9ACTN|nr:FAD-dependent oxidoreductase [Thermomonospora echinospora]SEG80309.1 cholesterol oxidase [Thermomonospora echinospora]